MMAFHYADSMKRTQIQLDEWTYETLRRRAYERGSSISALVRNVLVQSLRGRGPRRRLSLKQFRFIGAGRSRHGRLGPVSERHDEALAETLAKRRAR